MRQEVLKAEFFSDIRVSLDMTMIIIVTSGIISGVPMAPCYTRFSDVPMLSGTPNNYSIGYDFGYDIGYEMIQYRAPVALARVFVSRLRCRVTAPGSMDS